MKQKRSGFWRRLFVTVAVFAVLLSGLLGLLNRMSDVSDTEQLELVRSSIHNALVTCYAVEGGYPSSLSYLKENYGVVYDESTIYVSYDAFASNIMPEIRVVRKGDGLQ